MNFDQLINKNFHILQRDKRLKYKDNFILDASIPTYEEFLASDVNSDGELNVVDIVNIVGMVLDTSFAQSVEWLDEHFPQLNVRGRLQALNYNWESTE